MEITNAIRPPTGRGKKHIKRAIIRYLSWLVIKDLMEYKKLPPSVS